MAQSNVPKVKPVLVFGYGNLSRGDDALGPLLLQYVESETSPILDKVEILSDFQLQIEHALDLQGRDLVLFVDASVAVPDGQAFGFTELAPCRDDSYTTHAMSPAAVLSVYQNINKQTPPPCFLLSIKGERFELGEGLSTAARQHLSSACTFTHKLLAQADSGFWRISAETIQANIIR